MPIQPNAFSGSIDGQATQIVTIRDHSGSTIHLCNYGARVVGWEYEQTEGSLLDIVLGFDSIQKYQDATEAFHGVTVGRYANRIAKASFSLGNQVYQLESNHGPNNLHGGSSGFHQKVWKVKNEGSNFVVFALHSPDGEGGFPGNLEVEVKYSIDNHELKIEYLAKTDQACPVSLTHHSYFNLNGEGSGSILDHEARFYAEYYTPVNEDHIPTGAVEPVYETPFNFTKWKSIGEDINKEDAQLKIAGGFDHNFVVRNYHESDLKPVAEVRSSQSKLKLTCWTDKPGFQFYSANFMDGSDVGKSGKPYAYRESFAIEPQFFPDSPNQDDFPSSILHPGEEYKSTTIYALKSLVV